MEDVPQINLDHLEENRKIMNVITKWIQGKVDKNKWESLKHQLEDISIQLSEDRSEQKCFIKCFCGIVITISKFGKKERWIYSNFHSHMSRHLKDSIKNEKKRCQTSLLTNFLSISNETKSKESEINILDNKIIKTADSKKLEYKNSVGFRVENGEQYDHEFQMLESTEDNSQNGADLSINQAKSYSSNIEEGLEQPKEGEEESNETECFKDMTKNRQGNNEENLEPKPKGETWNEIEHNMKTKDQTGTNLLKWKSFKYQRSERLIRKREKLSLSGDQSRITDYLEVVEKISEAVNKMESAESRAFLSGIKISDQCLASQDKDTVLSNFLHKLLTIAKENSKHKRNEYSDFIKKVGIYLLRTGGRLLYETLQSNLKNILPSISSLNRFSKETNENIMTEAAFDFAGLEKYCDQRNIPKVVWICEDGTRITGKREYDKRTNCVVGFVLPLKNGVPQANKYFADSEENIVSYFENSTPKATIAYLIIAQPLSANVPPYVLCAFGTDNKFNHNDVLQRWEFIKVEAAKFNIRILGFSSDGDTRLLKAMRIASSLPNENSNHYNWPWFAMDMKNEEIYVQDTTHILTKLRTRLLKFGIQLPIGKYFISVNHLHELIKGCSKGLHRLTNWHLRAEDKMNFSAAEKICSIAVMDHLKEIPNAEGTSSYLKLMRYMIDSFLDQNTCLESKIYMSWYSVFF
ncbi:unnamed protein product [Callosobruchus maculatus]|uniref:Uncharacterized protein n=1 Tax=Callosobruchus maculatus TaxID=64391 RepID=A0A653DC43_CALMS|nr:unnamed protein product [Callosobruchus maculatus]